MSPRNWFQSYMASQTITSSRRQAPKPRPRCRLAVELLERRDVPSALSVSDVTVREGPTATGILDPSGAGSVGVNGIREITFDNGPSDPHYGDLFVTGWLSHSVARFDWASQTYQPFVAPNSGGLGEAFGITVGPDASVYVSDPNQNEVFRYDGTDGHSLGTFVPANSGGLTQARGLTFGADGNLYVCSRDTNQILRYQGPAGLSPGAFMGVFASVTNGSDPHDLTFGPDGNLYVSCYYDAGISAYGQINCYNGVTGAPVGNGVFVPHASGGLIQPREIVFDPQGNLYVVEDLTGNTLPGPIGQVLRYQGPNGQNPGAYVEAYITGGQAGLSIPIGLARDTAGNLYVSDRDTANVTRFAPSSQATFTVTLDSASARPVSVNYATANGTAVAGTDYTPTSGTLVFAPGVTAQTASVPITTVASVGPTKTFTINLSNASGASINRGQGTGSILNRMTKFFVVDSGTVKTYEYGSGGTSEEITVPQNSTDTAPRGVATTVGGTTVWVADVNKNVYVYDNHGGLLGSWAAGGLPTSSQVTGIATNGTDIWLLDSRAAKVYKYTGAASRLSGSQNAASSFTLAGGKNGNTNPQDLVTDGTSFWVVDGTVHKVFKYMLSGSSLGSWSIDPANAHPTGITINPNNVSDIWIVDNVTLKVYQYTAAAGRTSGSQNAAGTFVLNPYDTNPQGIADPPPPSAILPLPIVPNTNAPQAVLSEGGASFSNRSHLDDALWGSLVSRAPNNGSEWRWPDKQGDSVRFDVLTGEDHKWSDAIGFEPTYWMDKTFTAGNRRIPTPCSDLSDVAALDRIFEDGSTDPDAK
jgi:sugar lactone lactonase YvrE